MLRFRRLFISLAAAVIAGSLVYAVYVILLKQVEMQETIHVVVPKQLISAGTVLESDMLELQGITAAGVNKQMITNMQAIIGKQALIPLGAGEPVLEWKLSERLILPEEGEAVFEIPRDYILAISGAVRAGDHVRVYLSNGEHPRRLLINDVRVASVRMSGQRRDREDPEARGAKTQTDSNYEALVALRSGELVESINLNLREEEWLLIDAACRRADDAKLVIAYPAEQSRLQEQLTMLRR